MSFSYSIEFSSGFTSLDVDGGTISATILLCFVMVYDT